MENRRKTRLERELKLDMVTVDNLLVTDNLNGLLDWIASDKKVIDNLLTITIRQNAHYDIRTTGMDADEILAVLERAKFQILSMKQEV